jgi:hypothetical protein
MIYVHSLPIHHDTLVSVVTRPCPAVNAELNFFFHPKRILKRIQIPIGSYMPQQAFDMVRFDDSRERPVR